MRPLLAALLLWPVSAKADTGRASYYSEPQKVACGGGRFDPSAMTAATRNHPCGTKLRVCNVRNDKCVIVTRNDHGPAAWTGKIIDLSRAAFEAIEDRKRGVVSVSIEVLK